MSIDISKLDIAGARRDLLAKKYSAVELARAAFSAINAKNKELNAFLEVFEDWERGAQHAQKILDEAGENAPILCGIPVAHKDNMLNQGRVSSSGSKILENYVSSFDATAIKKMKDAGAVIMGRTNMDEFAMGSSGENSAFGPAKNPHDTSRVPGGSSSGSAVSIAAGMVLGALGSDTGGSVRQPAGFSGVVGFKPTYGAISRFGLTAMASSLDHIGTFGKTVEDARIMFSAVAGNDGFDSTSLLELAWDGAAEVTKKTIGVPEEFLKEGIDEDVRKNFDASLEVLKKNGWEIKSITLPTLAYSLPTYYIIQPAEVSSNMARFDGVKYGLHVSGDTLLDDYKKTRGAGFGREVKRRIMLGTYVLSSGYYDAYYNKARAMRAHIKNELARALQEVAVVALPTSPTPAFKIGDRASDPLSMYLADIFTVPANITGFPAISLPMGMVSREGSMLPTGIQFMGPWKGDALVFSVAKEFEKMRK